MLFKNKGWEESELSPGSPPPITRKLSLGFSSGFVHIPLAWLFCWVQGNILLSFCTFRGDSVPCWRDPCADMQTGTLLWSVLGVHVGGGVHIAAWRWKNRKLVPGQY